MSLWMLRNSDSRLYLALQNFFNCSCCSALILKWLFSQCKVSSNQTSELGVIPNTNDNHLIIKTLKSTKEVTHRVMNYSAKISNNSERASNVLLSNVKLNEVTTMEDGVEARRNRKQNRRGVKDARTARNTTRNGTDRAETQLGNGSHNEQDANAERATHEETGNKTNRTKFLGDGLKTRRENGLNDRKCRASSVQQNGKAGAHSRKTSKQRAGI